MALSMTRREELAQVRERDATGHLSTARAVADRRFLLGLVDELAVALERFDEAARLVIQSQKIGQRRRQVALAVALPELEAAVSQAAPILVSDLGPDA